MTFDQLSNTDQIDRLRNGQAGRYKLSSTIGESYQVFEALLSEAKGLATRFDGIWTECEATQVHPGSVLIVRT